MNRRHFLTTTTTAAAGIAFLNHFSKNASAQISALPLQSGYNLDQIELIKSAILAPSSHNTQPWKFKLDQKMISILPDFTRRCPSVDPDDHHLFISLGCAAENLSQAASAKGFSADVAVDSNKSIDFHLSPTKTIADSLYQAIPSRQCTRTEYDGQFLSTSELNLLAKQGTGNGVQCKIITAKSELEKILEFVIEGNTAQMHDSAFMAELKTWIRFNKNQAVEMGDGLYSATTGSPSLPTWLGKLIFSSVFTAKGENEKYSKHVRSSAGIAVFSSDVNDIKHWIEVGRCFERFALQASLLNVRTAMINQPVEVPEIRPLFSSYLGLGRQTADLVVRFGRGPLVARSMRRKLEAVLI